MSDTHTISLTHEELAELETILESQYRSALVELRRSSPNSECRHYLGHRTELLKVLIETVQKASHAEAVTSDNP